MVHRCVINSVVMWLHIWCVYVALFGSRLCFLTVQHTHTHTHTHTHLLIYAVTFQVFVTVHREHKVKRENQKDATISMFIIKLSVSTCFGHHYAHHQENKTVSYCMRCSAWLCRLWLAVVLWRSRISCILLVLSFHLICSHITTELITHR